MVNYTDLVDNLKGGRLLLLNLDCGLFILASRVNREAVMKLSSLTIIGGESVILLGKSSILEDYIDNVPEMANTLLELSDTPLNLRFKSWNHDSLLEPLFLDGLVLQVPQDAVFTRILGSLKGDLVAILVENRSIMAVKALGKMVDYVVDESTVKGIPSVLPGLIEFDKKGALKVIRE